MVARKSGHGNGNGRTRNMRVTPIVFLSMCLFTIPVGCAGSTARREFRGLAQMIDHLKPRGRGNVYSETIQHLRGGQDLVGLFAHLRNEHRGLWVAAADAWFFIQPFELGELAMTWHHLAAQ